ncbi:MAG: PAS domain-containing sensor histidine kinase [Hyphomonadaceae bacterium]|nr:PAS domain-containing sensor histidine kinase [Hyphomonadaceae bacterium]
MTLVIAALLVLEAGALAIKAWEEKQTSDLQRLENLQSEAVALAERLDGQAATTQAAIALGQRAGAGRSLVRDALPDIDGILSLRDVSASPDGSRLRAAADTAIQSISLDEQVGLSTHGDLVFVLEQSGFPTMVAFAQAENWLPQAGLERRFTLAGDHRAGVGDPRLEVQAQTATLNQPRIQSGDGLMRSATACSPLTGTSIKACVTRAAPLFERGDILRFITYGLVLAAPLLAILGLLNQFVRSQAERDTLASEADAAQSQLDLVMSGARAGSWAWLPDLECADLSPMAAELFGLPGPGKYDLDTLIECVFDSDRRLVRESLSQAREKGWLQASFATRDSDGNDFVEIRASSENEGAGESGGISGIVMDVTEQRRTDVRLRKAERRLRNAIEGFSGPFALWDGRRRLLYWNRSFVTTFGLEDVLRPGISHETVELAKASAIVREKQGMLPETGQVVEVRGGVWIKLVERPTAEDGLITIGIDVTESVRNETLLEQQKSRLKTALSKLDRSEAQATEMAKKYQKEKVKAEHAAHSKSAFLANMSHELRTPLNAINGFSQILAGELYGPLGDERYKGYANDILTSGEHLLDLINDILDMAKIEAGKMSVNLTMLDPIDPVDAAVRMIRRKAEEKNIALVLDAPTDLPEIEADHRAIRQMALNLISNALKFTDPEGRVVVSLRLQDEEIRISVTDTGIGIPRDQIQRLGKPFEQVKDNSDRNYEGTGLGLALTKSFAEMHGGRLAIASELGKGTRVSIYLPLEVPKTDIEVSIPQLPLAGE